MATDNNIKNFTAADIEKYHKGLLAVKERHELEKAALDDPFLADALEGYAVAGLNISTDLDDLKKRLVEKIEAGKVVVIKGGGKASFPWLRVAALLVIVAGAGLLAKQFVFKNNSKNIAQADTKKEEVKAGESTTTGTISPVTDSVSIISGTSAVPLNQTKTYLIAPKDSMAGVLISKESSGNGQVSTEYSNVSNKATQPVVSPPVRNDNEKNNTDYKVQPGNADKKEMTKEEVKDKLETSNKDDAERNEVKGVLSKPNDDRQNNRAVAANHKFKEDQNYRNQVTNTFRGRVTDSNNVGLPFARVYNPADNYAGTYTDVAGNFNLTYPDSVLSVQVKSVGFENTNVQLRNNVTNNQVILRDDKSLAAQTLPAPRKINAEERNKLAKVKLEEPEPADGWDNYDTYLTNNLNVPDELKTKQNESGQVQVSFEVDKKGEPINIKVEKSLCSKCDQEAIRLIKEGPKWKRNAKKGRTTVTVPFNNSL